MSVSSTASRVLLTIYRRLPIPYTPRARVEDEQDPRGLRATGKVGLALRLPHPWEAPHQVQVEFTGGRGRLQLGEAGGAGPEKTERMRLYQEGDEGHPRGSAWQEGCSAAGALLPSGGQRPAAELDRGWGGWDSSRFLRAVPAPCLPLTHLANMYRRRHIFCLLPRTPAAPKLLLHINSLFESIIY